MGDLRLSAGWRAVFGGVLAGLAPFFGRPPSDAACVGVVVVVR
jgi:hypothetical protein